jgi:hypothetical protein
VSPRKRVSRKSSAIHVAYIRAAGEHRAVDAKVIAQELTTLTPQVG